MADNLNSAVIFPAFSAEYDGDEEFRISPYKNNFRSNLEHASLVTGINMDSFHFSDNNFLDNEEASQYISYVFSCSLSDILADHGVKPQYVSGYSMGIYAALYFSGAISFDDGLNLIRKAWAAICEATSTGEFGMGMVIGLEKNEILRLIGGQKDIMVCNSNNKHTYILSGYKEPVMNVLESAREEGALTTALLPVTKPYHSIFMAKGTASFDMNIREITFRDPRFKYLSSLNQKIITTGAGLRDEVLNNLSGKMNWHYTMAKLAESDIDVIFECGAGDGLTRNSRFIDGSFRSLSIKKLDEFLKQH